ncbi:unnamed protein product, partial [Protopolystoma xenopodis]
MREPGLGCLRHLAFWPHLDSSNKSYLVIWGSSDAQDVIHDPSRLTLTHLGLLLAIPLVTPPTTSSTCNLSGSTLQSSSIANPAIGSFGTGSSTTMTARGTQLSCLESYFSASLLFHAGLVATRILAHNGFVKPLEQTPSGSTVDTLNSPPQPDVYQAACISGDLVCTWLHSGLTTRLFLHPFNPQSIPSSDSTSSREVISPKMSLPSTSKSSSGSERRIRLPRWS